jgi:hypothetical protein
MCAHGYSSNSVETSTRLSASSPARWATNWKYLTLALSDVSHTARGSAGNNRQKPSKARKRRWRSIGGSSAAMRPTTADLPPVQSPLEKHFRSRPTQITLTTRPVPDPLRGAYRDRHERWVRDAVDANRRAQFLRGRAAHLRTAKSCGPDAPTLASTW